MPDIIHHILKTYFGYDSFRPQQEEIIRNVLAGNDTVVLMPTGGGKSLCFQIPAMALEGITLVVSPLIALMKDQVDAMIANGIPAVFINSSLSAREIFEIQEELQRGKIKLLYIAPERLALLDFQVFLKSLPISLIAVDEAHCISEWGHEFRPDYRNLQRCKQVLFPHVPIIALTATATLKVKEDIITQLHLQTPKVFLASFDRPNLFIRVKPKQQAFKEILLLLKKYTDEAVIIYCLSRKETETLAVALNKEGHKATAYHAGMSSDERKKAQDRFKKDQVSIIVATIAFGMGIDKPDVRLVIHYSLPKSIEGYYQEIGRAGRDGLASECVLFYTYGDTRTLEYFIGAMEDADEQRRARVKLQEIVDYCEAQGCRRNILLRYFGEVGEMQNCASCDTCTTTKETFDGTVIAQKILSAVIKTGQKFGAQHVISVLRGSKNQGVLSRGHDSLSVYGIVKDYDDSALRLFIKELASKGYLLKDEIDHNIFIFKVSAKGMDALKQRASIELTKPPVAMAKGKSSSSGKGSSTHSDNELFQELRALRRKIAEQRNVPPFVIFSDKSLLEMTEYLPQEREQFSKIFGVGAQKLEDFGHKFMEVIRQYAGKKL
ncbi:MAG: DNA helicase RecQ [bacterium]|nr:DNA helicase RecQ [bacterium]